MLNPINDLLRNSFLIPQTLIHLSHQQFPKNLVQINEINSLNTFSLLISSSSIRSPYPLSKIKNMYTMNIITSLIPPSYLFHSFHNQLSYLIKNPKNYANSTSRISHSKTINNDCPSIYSHVTYHLSPPSQNDSLLSTKNSTSMKTSLTLLKYIQQYIYI